MFGKFSLFFVVALCVTQGFSTYSVEPDTRGVIDDIITGIKNTIKNIESAIRDIITNIPNLFKNLNDKIKEIIEKIDVEGFIGNIQDKIEDMLASAGIDVSIARKCQDAQKAEIDQLFKETTEAIANCKSVADDSKENLAEEMKQLKTKAYDLIAEINTGMKQCFHEHGLNPIQLVKCMGDHFADIKDKADVLVRQISETIITATKTAADITVTLARCTAEISTDLISKERQIIQNFQKCVDEINQ